MPKVLIFSLAYLPFVGGAEVAIKEITDRLPDYEFEMITVNLDGKQKSEEKIGNVFIRRIGTGKQSKYFFPFAAAKLAEKLHLERKFDAIWAMMANQAGLAALFFKKKNSEIPYLLTLQEGDSDFDIWLRTFFIRPWYNQIYRRADYIQAISNFLANRAKKMGATCPVEVVPNGVDLGRIKKQESRNKENNKKIIITVSRLEKKNGIDILIKAFKELGIGNHELWIIGDGSLENDLKKLVRELNLENQVKFIGKIEPDNIYNYLFQADIFVRPSRSEGLGNAFLEAMAASLPIIGTPVGGIPDFLEDDETGIFCKVDDPADLAKKIKLLLNDNNLRENLINNGKKLVEEKYQWNSVSIKMNDIFNKII